MVGQAFAVAVAVIVEVEVVVIVRAVGLEREVVRMSSRREIWVDVWIVVEVGPGQMGSDVGRGGM